VTGIKRQATEEVNSETPQVTKPLRSGRTERLDAEPKRRSADYDSMRTEIRKRYSKTLTRLGE